MRSFFIQTFGCRANQAEAFLWADELQNLGLMYEKDPVQSDLILVNTCTVTRNADRDVRKFIRNLIRLHPKAGIVVTGCYVQRSPEEFKGIPQVCGIYTNEEKEGLIREILPYVRPRLLVPVLPYRSRALVKIQDGCNFRCTFCIVPKVRGKSKSMEKERVLALIRKYIDQGFQEVALTGIHLCSYGLDLKPKTSLLELLEEIEQLDGLGHLRLSSLDPRFLNLPLLRHITKSEKTCPHFHLSLQNGSERILRRMGRSTKIEEYRNILDDLRRHSPQASLGADIIVGFPGESEEDFERTYSFLESSPLTYFHVFSYSPRPSTEAASWPQVDERVKKERAALLRSLGQRKNLGFRQQFAGKTFEAIVIKKVKECAQVLTPNYLKVNVASCPSDIKEKVRVKITRVSMEETRGHIIP